MNQQTLKDLAWRRVSARLSLPLARRRGAVRRAGLLMVLSAVLICFGGVLVGVSPAYAAGPYPAPVISNCAAGSAPVNPTGPGYPAGVGDVNFKVWTCGTDSGAFNAAVKALGIAASHYPDMTAMMGPPRPDSGSAAEGGDTRIDIYLVSASAGQQITRYDDSNGQPTTSTIGNNVPAETVSTDKSATSTYSSAWMVLDSDALSSGSFDSNFVHEFFHVLSNAYNVGGECYDGRPDWFVEASATWAQSYFSPSTALTAVYSRFTRGFEPEPGMSLTSTGIDPSGAPHDYSAFIWPYFMQQNKGIAAIANAWQAMEGKTTCEEMNQAIDSVLPFQDYFRNFALENLDSPLPNIGNGTVHQWPTSFPARYQDTPMDPNFPTALPKESSATPTLNTSTSKAVKVADLATQYNHWQTGPQTASAGNVGISLEFNFSGITHRQNLDIIAVAAEYNLVGKSRPYLVIPVPAKSNHLRICAPADNIVGKTDLEGIGVHLILANHSMAANGTVGGSYTVTPRSVCAASASGSYTETFSSTEQGVPPYNEQLTLTNVHFIPAGAYPGWAFDPTQGTYKFISTFGNASGPLSQVVCCGPNLSGWDLSAYSYQPGFGVTATEFGPPDFLVVEGGVCPVAASGLGPTAGKYINNLRAIDLTCSGSGTVNGANDHVSTSGTIQVQDPIRCGIWKGSRCDVTAAANTPSRAG